MKMTLKRLLAAVALVMMLSALTIPVFAADEDEWFIGTWSVSDWDSGAAVKIESSGASGIVNVYQLMISTRSKGNEITKLRGCYQAEYTIAPDGTYILISPSLPDEDGHYFCGIKVFKPEGNSDTLKMVMSPRELTGNEGTEGTSIYYRRDPGFLPDNESDRSESSVDNKDSDSTGTTEAKDDDHDSSDDLGDGSYASDFDDMTPGEVAITSAVAMTVAAGIAAGAAGVSGSGGSGKNGIENGGDGTYVLKDPATGAESLYIYDDTTGEWVSDDGRTVLDPSRISQWQKDRVTDRQVADDAMDNLRTRNTEFDRNASKAYQEEQAKQKREDYVNKVGTAHGVYSEDATQVREVLGGQQKSAEKMQELWNTHADHVNIVTVGTEVVGKAADLSIDAMATAASASGNPIIKYTAKGVQAGYYGIRNITANVADAVVNKKDVWSAVHKGYGETVVDITQANVDKLGYKFVAYTVGDAYKKVMSSIDEGKISADELSNAAKVGATDGMKKTLTAAAFKYAGEKLKPTGKVELKTDTAIKNLTKETSKKSANLLGAYEGGTISRTTYDGAKSVLNAKYVAEVRQIKKMADSYVKATEKVAKVARDRYDVVSNVLENMTGDVATGNNPFKRN